MVKLDPSTGYFLNIDDIRMDEYPMLQGQHNNFTLHLDTNRLLIDTTYLDHAGTTIYARSLVTAISDDFTTNLYGNPHSGSSSSQLSSRRIEDTRVQVLRFLNADPDLFDIVFVANATAAIKLVADAFRDHAESFFYGYHVDSHTSLVGVRELAGRGSQCFFDDQVEQWLSGLKPQSLARRRRTLFGYPGQSNLSGHRPPLSWCSRIYELRRCHDQRIYSLYDAAALLSTSSLDFSNSSAAPDFTALSFYKIFGLPDLGALVVRKECSDLFLDRKFFGGGTVEMIISLRDQWHASKQSSLHSRLEDGTVPFHSIIALSLALSTHSRLFGSMDNISRHTSFLAERVHNKLSSLTHLTGARTCQIYGPPAPDFKTTQGPTIAFNLRDAKGNWIGKSEVERLASVRDIQLRTGGMCNPGGIATNLDLSASELRNNFAVGQKCGDDNDVLNGKPTGVVRVSFGAMSNIADADKFIAFIDEFFVQGFSLPLSPPLTPPPTPPDASSFRVQSLSIFPIKSCAAFKVPPGLPWIIREEGLAWDREWCLVHQGTGVALSQKRYPRMAMIRPSIDIDRRMLTVQYYTDYDSIKTLQISLDSGAGSQGIVQTCSASTSRSAIVCGERQEVQVLNSAEVANFFTRALEVPCTLARHQKQSAGGKATDAEPEATTQSMPGDFPTVRATIPTKPTILANESPILLVSQSSVDNLNSSIRSKDPDARAVLADSFRGNIVIAQQSGQWPAPYAEDHWTSLRIGDDSATQFSVIGPCQRCQMVCVDQQTAKRSREPYSTLAKTRRRDGKVWFGMHLSPVLANENLLTEGAIFIKVGDTVNPRR
jgi:molybdenum cofactor sulfurtransferase